MRRGMEYPISRYIEVLDYLIRRSGLSGREIERRLGWALGLLPKVLGRDKNLKVSHVLEILAALNVDPLLFYSLAHSEKPVSDETFAALAKTIGSRPAGELPAMTRDELEEHLENAVRRALSQAKPFGS
jgi:hypothetical protein